MADQKIEISRTKVGLLCIACLATAFAIFAFAPTNDDWPIWQGAFTRVGLVLGALWLALPSKTRQAAWANVSPSTFFGLIFVIVLWARYPRFVTPLIIVIAVIGYFLRPRDQRRPKS